MTRPVTSLLTLATLVAAALTQDLSPAPWRARVRARMRAAFAPLPPEDCDPPAVDVVRRLAREGYAIEHLLIESRPGMRVPAHLQLPDPARFPPPVAGVLVPRGHSAEGKAHPAYQVGAAALALHGMAALVFDPLEQGERVQALDGEGRPVRWGARAHDLSGARAALVGWSQAGLEGGTGSAASTRSRSSRRRSRGWRAGSTGARSRWSGATRFR